MLAGAVLVCRDVSARSSPAEGDGLAFRIAKTHRLPGKRDRRERPLVEENHIFGAADRQGCAGCGNVGIMLKPSLFDLIFSPSVRHAKAGSHFIGRASGDKEFYDSQAVENDGLIRWNGKDNTAADAGAEFSPFVENLTDFDGLPFVIFRFAGLGYADNLADGGL